MTWLACLVVLAAYLLGGILGGRLLGTLMGVDLRASGSGNIGATNALRTRGVGFGLAVLVIDAGKGALAVLLLPTLVSATLTLSAQQTLPFLCGAAATLGHCFPPWHGFNGGKGVATLAGTFLALLPELFGWSLLLFALTILLTGIVSLATLIATLTATALSLWHTASMLSAPSLFAASMTVLVLYTHRDNWRRLAQGAESRFERARLLGRWLRLP